MTIRAFAIAAALLASTGATAADFSFTGNFAHDSSRAVYSFSIGAPGTVDIDGFGYAEGGFDTAFSLYGPDRFAVDFNDDEDGVFGDSRLTLALGAGSYTLLVTQYDNLGPAFLGGNTLAFSGQPNFRGGFVDFFGSQRTNAFGLDIRGVDGASVTSVPEAATWTMLIVGFGLVGAAARRRSAVAAA